MINIKLLAVFLLTLVLVATPVFALEGPVWRVTKGPYEMFIGGTIHVLSQDDYPLPTAFEAAYQRANILAFETDVEKTKTPTFQKLVLAKSLYPSGLTLKNVLSRHVYKDLSDYLESRGGNIESVEKFKPGMLSTLLTIEELYRLGQAGQGVDDFYNAKAVKDNKPLFFFESIEQQLSFLAEMGKGQEDILILQTLEDIKELPSILGEIKAAWRTGNNRQLEKVALAPWRDKFPETYQSLLVNRNNAWMPHLHQMMQTPAVEYVLVGVLHLVGSDGISHQLRAAGYQVDKLSN